MRRLKHLQTLTRHLLYKRFGDLCKCERCSYIRYLTLNTYTFGTYIRYAHKKRTQKQGYQISRLGGGSKKSVSVCKCLKFVQSK